MGKVEKNKDKELEKIIKEITEEAKKVVEDYVKHETELSGSITQVHEDSPLLNIMEDEKDAD
jgi:hypothetical protein